MGNTIYKNIKEYKNNIFDVIKQIDKKNYQYFDSLNEEQKKEIHPYTLARWMTTVAQPNDHKKDNIDIK